MDNLKNIFLQNIQAGLNRKTITTCSRWAEKYRVISSQPFPGPWRFLRHPWLYDMHNSQAELNVGMKSAQVGFTETVLNIAFYNIDIKRKDVLYVLPAKHPDSGDFSSGRFDAALESSDHLRQLFSDTKNIGHKRAGSTNMYLRGSRSRGGLKSVPVGLLILDELEEFTEKNIPLALERTSGQIEKQTWMISTPTLEGRGIHKYFLESSANHFFVRCPSCNRFMELEFPDSIEFNIEESNKSRLLCTLCKATLPHESKTDWLKEGRWIESYTDRDAKGWHISQLYSTVVSPKELTQFYIRAQNDLSDEQEFYNSKLGITHEVKGARITDKQINDAKKDYANGTPGYGLITMGVDVGHPYIHVEIDEWHFTSQDTTDISTHATPRVLYQGKVRQFEELDNFMREYQVNFCIIDAHPERRKAFEFASRFWGLVRLCFYVVGINGKQIHLSDAAEPSISVDRTSWLDLALGRFRSGTITIPYNIDMEYRDQLKEPVRVYEKDKDGNPIGVYSSKYADHYAHSRNYAEIALPLSISIGSSKSISRSVL